MSSISLEKYDQYIGELEAVKNYGKVNKERDDAIKRVDELLAINEELSGRLELLSKEKVDLIDQLREEEAKLQAMAQLLAVKEEEVLDLKERGEKLESLRAMLDGKSIKELPKTIEVEIQGMVDKRYEAMKSNWEKSAKPKEVSEQAIKQLKLIILGLKLPKWVRKFYPDPEVQVLSERVEEEIMADVNKRLDDEFNVRVEMESNRKVVEKIERMKKMNEAPVGDHQQESQ